MTYDEKIVIIPCAGASSRYAGTRPKWMLTDPDGSPMVLSSVSQFTRSDDIGFVVTILAEHAREYDAVAGLHRAFNYDGRWLKRVVVLDSPTSSQSETVLRTLRSLKHAGPFIVKDADNRFELRIDDVYGNNAVCVSSLTDYDSINARNKSYCIVNGDGIITGVHEKQIVSQVFSAGAYSFANADEFCFEAEQLINGYTTEIYVSHVINSLIGREQTFTAYPIDGPIDDWGTLDDWQHYIASRKTYFIDIDGVIFTNAGRYFLPRRYDNQDVIVANRDRINTLRKNGAMIILTTSRPEAERQQTLRQLSEAGLKYDQLVMDCNHAGRVLVNDFAKTNPYPSAVAVSMDRNGNLGDYI